MLAEDPAEAVDKAEEFLKERPISIYYDDVEFLPDSGHAVSDESGDTMSRRARRSHTPAFRAKVALAAIRGQNTVAELAQHFRIRSRKVARDHRPFCDAYHSREVLYVRLDTAGLGETIRSVSRRNHQ
jgi:hypothetical protein